MSKKTLDKQKQSKKIEGEDNVVDFIPKPHQLESAMTGLFGTQTGSDSLNDAQELMYEAWECPDPEQRIHWAKEALKLSPLCADAYCLLADESAESLDEALSLYEKAVKAGEEALGPDDFEEYSGHFWGFIETRPYMRARAGLAETLWAAGSREEAVNHYKEMLVLNPNDNQGVRYSLAKMLMELNRIDELRVLFDEFSEDSSAYLQYTRTLLAYQEQSDEMRAAAFEAWSSNKHVPAMLIGRAPLVSIGDYISMGGEDEASGYVVDFGSAWKRTPSAIDWLCGITSEFAHEAGETMYRNQKIGRNDLCPCGSGKKYKKCCLNGLRH